MISIENLSVQYAKQYALYNISCDIPDKTFFSILGPNGAGKTTFLKVMLGLIPIQSGSVKIFSKEPAQVPSEWIGYVPQIKTLDFNFPARAIELVISGFKKRWPAFNSKEELSRASEILEKIGAMELAQRPLNELSGGELQRIYVARALIRKPRIIVLDEPTTGIDATGEKDIYLILENYQKEYDASILMVTHDWDVSLHHSTHVMLLNRYMIAFGHPKDILREECLRRTFGHQGHDHEMFMGEKK